MHVIVCFKAITMCGVVASYCMHTQRSLNAWRIQEGVTYLPLVRTQGVAATATVRTMMRKNPVRTKKVCMCMVTLQATET